MLVRRRVDADVGVILLKHPLQAFFIGDADDFHPDVQLALVGEQQTLLQVVGAVLIDIQHNQLLGLHFRQLPAQLRTD